MLEKVIKLKENEMANYFGDSACFFARDFLILFLIIIELALVIKAIQ